MLGHRELLGHCKSRADSVLPSCDNVDTVRLESIMATAATRCHTLANVSLMPWRDQGRIATCTSGPSPISVL